MPNEQRRRLLQLMERAWSLREQDYPEFFDQGEGLRFRECLNEGRARGVDEAVVLSRLRKNPGLLCLH